jgi:hypothetical protein
MLPPARSQRPLRPGITNIGSRSFRYNLVHGACYKRRMDDQIIDLALAQALQTDVTRTSPIAGWVVMRDPPDYPDKIIARLVTDRPTPYVLMAESLAELQAQLPPERQPADLPEVVEIWFPA